MKQEASGLTPDKMALAYYENPSDQLRNDLVVRLMRVADSVAARYSFMEEHDDLVSAAYESLLDSVTRFDPNRGVPVAKFAAVNSILAIKRYLKTEAAHRLERCPSDVDSEINSLRMEQLAQATADGKVRNITKLPKRTRKRKRTYTGPASYVSAEKLSRTIRKETGRKIPVCDIIQAAGDDLLPDGTVAVFQTAIYVFKRKEQKAKRYREKVAKAKKETKRKTCPTES